MRTYVIISKSTNTGEIIIYNTPSPSFDVNNPPEDVIKILTDDELDKYNITGLENYVYNGNTRLNDDGTITFNRISVINELADDVRFRRNDLLEKTDKLMTLDYPISDEDREKVKKYRQALRDITEDKEFPLFESNDYKVPWPKKEWEKEKKSESICIEHLDV